jgi:flagellar biosynthesis protein FlhF
MNVMRFVGRTSREAMKKLRDALGPDALVLANRPCAEGVELLAAAPGALGGLPAEAPVTPAAARPGPDRAAVAPPVAPEPGAPGIAGPQDAPPSMSTVSFQDYVRQRLRERARSQAEPRDAEQAAAGTARLAASARAAVRTEPIATQDVPPQRPIPVPGAAPLAAPSDAPLAASLQGAPPESLGILDSPAPAPARYRAPPPPVAPYADPPRQAAPAQAGAAAPATDALMAELQSLRGVMARQFSTISWFEGVRRSPVQGRLLKTMVAAGFSLKLARSVVSRLPSDYGERDAQSWLEEVLARNLRCASAAEAFRAGTVCALVGPTGVGKTTTTAKIAARHVLAHGVASVALITVDTYRLGAHDQLRAFGRILGVPVHVAHDAPALHDLLRLRNDRQLVLIDTVGLGHRDERIRSLLMSLPRTEIRHVVVANASAQAETIDASLRAFEARQAVGVVLTKVDEAARLGGAIDCLVRQRTPLLGVCDGQRVPEDWHEADSRRLVRQALLAPGEGAFALDDEELPLVFGVAAARQGEAVHA